MVNEKESKSYYLLEVINIIKY